MSVQNSALKHHARKASADLDPYSAPQVYYGDSHRKYGKTRTYSSVSGHIYRPDVSSRAMASTRADTPLV